MHRVQKLCRFGSRLPLISHPNTLTSQALGTPKQQFVRFKSNERRPSLRTSDPFWSLESWSPFKSFFDEPLFNSLMKPSTFFNLEPTSKNFPFSPKIDVTEKDDHYLIHAELPGVPKENVKIEVSDGYLTLRGEKHMKVDKEDKQHKRIYTESSYGAFSRRFPLPEGVKQEDIKASFKDGVLNLTIPRPKEEKKEDIYHVPIE